MSPAPIERAFVRVDEGLVHFRHAAGDPAQLPLVLLHASPGSSRGLVPLLEALSATGQAPRLIAPDTLGHGDSAAPALAEPDIAYYARALIRLLDAMKIDRVLLYGAHTGARIACETAVLFPDRIDRVVLDGIADYDDVLRPELVARYAPEMVPDEYGRQFIWAFNFVRDQALHFPHYARDPAHRLLGRVVPDADALHEAALDVLKSLRTYHKAYRAAFRYEAAAQLALCQRPCAILDDAEELPHLRKVVTGLIECARGGIAIPVSSASGGKAAALLRWTSATVPLRK